jgi:two-component system C4-dicarboxylate transport response regulator DctD
VRTRFRFTQASPAQRDDLSLPQRIEKFEVETIVSALELTHGSVKQALELLKIPRKTFYDKINRHQMDINRYRIKAD